MEAIRYYTRQGYVVSVPMTEACRYDLIVDDGDTLKRIQCKTSSRVNDAGTFEVNLGTSGGNQSWRGQKKPLSAEEFDELFIWCSDDSTWIIPSREVDGRSSMSVGKFNQQYRTQDRLFVSTLLIEKKTKLCICGAEIRVASKSCRSCSQKSRRNNN